VDGPSGEATELLNTVVPVAAVPRLDNLCGGGLTQVAVAGERAMVQLFNPVGSGITATLYRFWVALESGGIFSLRLHNVALADAETQLQVYNRTLGNQPEPSAQIRSLNGSGVGDTTMEFRIATAVQSQEFNLARIGDDQRWAGLSLAEGRGVIVVPSTDDINNTTSFLWSERITE